MIKQEESQVNSQRFLFHINGECLKALNKVDYKVGFGVRYVKVNVFPSAKPDDDLELVDATNELMKIDGRTGSDDPPMQAKQRIAQIIHRPRINTGTLDCRR